MAQSRLESHPVVTRLADSLSRITLAGVDAFGLGSLMTAPMETSDHHGSEHIFT